MTNPAGLALEWHDALPADWDAWANARGGSFATRAGFLEALAEFPGGRLRLLAATAGGTRVGALPLFVSRRFGRDWVRSLPFGTYGGPLRATGAPDHAVCAALAQGAASWFAELPVAGGEIVLGPGGDGGAPCGAWSGLAQATTRGRTHLVDLSPGVEALHAALRKQTREGFRKTVREGVQVAEDPAALPAVHALYLEQARRWRVRRPYPLPFLSRLLSHPSGFARHLVARRGAEVLAGLLVLSGGGETFLWWTGIAASARQALAYPYLLWHGVQLGAASGDRRVNLGGSSGQPALERFKEHLGGVPAPVTIHHLRPGRPDSVATLIQWARALVRRS